MPVNQPYPSSQITPFEMGSFDPNLSTMIKTKFVGTHLLNGQPANDTACVTGFDQASFMIGSVSNLFNVCFPFPFRIGAIMGTDGVVIRLRLIEWKES